jgi:hypothetical protein
LRLENFFTGKSCWKDCVPPYRSADKALHQAVIARTLRKQSAQKATRSVPENGDRVFLLPATDFTDDAD